MKDGGSMEHRESSKEAQIARMKELKPILLEASRAYYAEDREHMTNLEYDTLYEEYVHLEEMTGVILSGSPTQTVGYEAVEELPKEAHEVPMLSLNKTKSVEELAAFAGTKKILLSWKMDGLTIVLTYQGGKIAKAVTRGNGEIGEVITQNARVFENLPVTIPYTGELVLRGEAVISYPDFEKINREIPEAEAKYKNPRNLCSGSVRQLDSRITAERHVSFHAFSLVRAEGVEFQNSRKEQVEWLRRQGFSVVPYIETDAKTIAETVAQFAKEVETNPIPSDGLVAVLDDIEYGRSLGRTAKYPRDSIAFKWKDEQAQTTLLEMEWSASRTGLINPVAIFEPVELEGTTVSRASVHNVSIVKQLKLGIGDQILVFKANMIIPQIAENLTGSGSLPIPETCPVCHGTAMIRRQNDVESLYCINPDCQAKKIKAFTLFVSRDGMNLDGFSEATLEKLIDHGLVREYADLFHLDRYREEIIAMEGFGERSFENLVKAAEAARETTLPRLIYALGIPNIGVANAKLVCKAFHYDLSKLKILTEEELVTVDGFGSVMAGSWVEWFEKEQNLTWLENLEKELKLEVFEEEEKPQPLKELTFVITGTVTRFKNRKELSSFIEALGGKVAGSVSSKTGFLINNDVTSTTGKNKKARELGIPVLSEEDFLAQFSLEEELHPDSSITE